MKYSLIALAAITRIAPSSAFVVPPLTPTKVNPSANNNSLAAVDAAMAVDPTYVLAGVGAAVSAIGGAAIAFGRNLGRSTTATKTPAAVEVAEPELIDVSIPYDAAALLAYHAYAESSSSKVDFKQFKSLYLEQMVAEVKATVQERKVNEMKAVLNHLENDALSIKGKIDALFSEADIISASSANDIDISIDYDSAAKLAYALSDKSLDFESFREVYESETVAMVAAKNPYKK